ncbi:MAG: LysR family transcriptional regulator [Kurthia gibsonii]|uniref:LysR family transcriptional regulator n=1 Tax=Kurthia gibsonii TaxID=33946 RepID=A0ABU9LLQ2_9BACL|nr:MULTISPECIES: LysR family transcriptional regulator [Kurthia]MCA9724067.1 LysR family transcriptional regulator [Kurthia sp.]AMA63617.1 bacterial regulatory helix-turn-helix, lysR family protein [Kurthia sp. 11kri321]MEB6113286.1 LysR family transcriptional regulator [Kurthia gibsonii]RXH52283.1 LysR family transcriptional regulator [Kurthia gibsonii]WIL37946.1 LysR family transcriptional regulator [Kurthia sp. YJT4]
MELRQLRYFVAVAEREHISEAAESLHVAQSAVSRQISNLETELGTELFERIGRNVKLTPIGKIFLEHALIALEAIDFAAKQVEEYLDPEQGTIKIGFPTSLASFLLPTVISAFKKEHPNVSFHLRQGSYRYLINAVKNRELNLVFLGPVPKKDEIIDTKILFTEKISALLPATHPLATKKEIQLADLRNEPFVLFPDGFILNKVVVDACKSVGYTPIVSSEGEDMDALKGLVAAGMGVTLLPESAFYDSTPRRTVRLPLSEPSFTRNVGVVFPHNRELAPSEKIFLEFVSTFFSRLTQFI